MAWPAARARKAHESAGAVSTSSQDRRPVQVSHRALACTWWPSAPHEEARCQGCASEGDSSARCGLPAISGRRDLGNATRCAPWLRGAVVLGTRQSGISDRRAAADSARGAARDCLARLAYACAHPAGLHLLRLEHRSGRARRRRPVGADRLAGRADPAPGWPDHEGCAADFRRPREARARWQGDGDRPTASDHQPQSWQAVPDPLYGLRLVLRSPGVRTDFSRLHRRSPRQGGASPTGPGQIPPPPAIAAWGKPSDRGGRPDELQLSIPAVRRPAPRRGFREESFGRRAPPRAHLVLGRRYLQQLPGALLRSAAPDQADVRAQLAALSSGLPASRRG